MEFDTLVKLMLESEYILAGWRCKGNYQASYKVSKR